MPQRVGSRLAATRGQPPERQRRLAPATDRVPNGTPSKTAVGLICGSGRTTVRQINRHTSAGATERSDLARVSAHWPSASGYTRLAHEPRSTLASSSRLLLFIISSLLHLFIAPNEASQPAQQRATLVVESAYSSPASSVHFPSARHFYHGSASFAPTSASLPPNVGRLQRRDRISSLHEQLNQLRRQLETELRAGAHDERPSGAHNDSNPHNNPASSHTRPPIQLGAPCLSSADCAQSIRNSHCSAANFTCVCLDQHVPINGSACLAPSLLGYECQLDAQCQQKVAHSLCLRNRCACPAHSFVAHRKNKCLPASKLNDYCLSDQQCQLNERHSFCKWKIPNVYGTCKCPPNYKQLAGSDASRCAPRLGDACFTDAECQLATAHSICSAGAGASGSSPASRGLLAQLTALGRAQLALSSSSWPTSSASSSRCSCAQGFLWAPDQLHCEPAPSAGASASTAASTAGSGLQDSHKYEMIVIAPAGEQQAAAGHFGAEFEAKRTSQQKEPAEQMDMKILDSVGIAAAPSSSTGAPASSTAGATSGQPTSTVRSIAAASEWHERPTTSTLRPALGASTKARMSSLGKTCESRADCQLRDPHSDCIAGRCECQMPTPRCRANSTGCHRDTFQCRNGQCISWYFVCDQFPNCDDASDELDCQANACPRESFQCQSGGACVARAKLCDGKRDCADASDERHCLQATRAPAVSANEISSDVRQRQPVPSSSASSVNASTLEGVAGVWANDLVAMSAPAPRCHPEAFSCRNGRQCLPGYVFCNAVADCSDASDEDELLCERPRAQRKWLEHLEREIARRKSASSSPDLGLMEQAAGHLLSLSPVQPQQRQQQQQTAGRPSAGDESPLVKTDRASIERLRAALALTSRTPESRGRPQGARRARLLDEQPPARPPDECPRWAFTCANGKCRSSAILCSGVDGCGDNSDEDRCEVCHCQPPPSA